MKYFLITFFLSIMIPILSAANTFESFNGNWTGTFIDGSLKGYQMDLSFWSTGGPVFNEEPYSQYSNSFELKYTISKDGHVMGFTDSFRAQVCEKTPAATPPTANCTYVDQDYERAKLQILPKEQLETKFRMESVILTPISPEILKVQFGTEYVELEKSH